MRQSKAGRGSGREFKAFVGVGWRKGGVWLWTRVACRGVAGATLLGRAVSALGRMAAGAMAGLKLAGPAEDDAAG